MPQDKEQKPPRPRGAQGFLRRRIAGKRPQWRRQCLVKLLYCLWEVFIFLFIICKDHWLAVVTGGLCSFGVGVFSQSEVVTGWVTGGGFNSYPSSVSTKHKPQPTPKNTQATTKQTSKNYRPSQICRYLNHAIFHQKNLVAARD